MKESECPPEYKNPRNPYLRSLVKQGRLCPSCGHSMWFRVSRGSADFGWWRCDSCGRLDREIAPEGMRVGGTQCEEPDDDLDADIEQPDGWDDARSDNEWPGVRTDAGGAKVLQFRPRGGRGRR